MRPQLFASDVIHQRKLQQQSLRCEFSSFVTSRGFIPAGDDEMPELSDEEEEDEEQWLEEEEEEEEEAAVSCLFCDRWGGCCTSGGDPADNTTHYRCFYTVDFWKKKKKKQPDAIHNKDKNIINNNNASLFMGPCPDSHGHITDITRIKEPQNKNNLPLIFYGGPEVQNPI